MFGEKKTENINGVDCPVWQTPKYEASKQKALEILSKSEYGLVEGDFWILMNTYANGTKVMYSGLILSHNGCLKINDKLEDPFKAQYLTREWLNESLIYEYNDGTLYEIGEVSEKNLKKNVYPYAMAFKRCFDRVVLKKSKLAYSGIYSEVEADEFKQKVDDNAEESTKEDETINTDMWNRLKMMYTKEQIRDFYDELGITRGTDIPVWFFLQKEAEYDAKFKAEHPEKSFY